MLYKSFPLTSKIVLDEPSPTAFTRIAEIHFSKASVTRTEVPDSVTVPVQAKIILWMRKSLGRSVVKVWAVPV